MSLTQGIKGTMPFLLRLCLVCLCIFIPQYVNPGARGKGGEGYYNLNLQFGGGVPRGLQNPDPITDLKLERLLVSSI